MYLLRLAARFLFFFFAFPPVLLFLGCLPPWLLAHWFPSLAFCWKKRKTAGNAQTGIDMLSIHSSFTDVCPSVVGSFKNVENVRSSLFSSAVIVVRQRTESLLCGISDRHSMNVSASAQIQPVELLLRLVCLVSCQ